jgi:hypothetical protein|tara:strand:+ start:15493 stop:15912 length:420 start_codon:yes stop_codon:yes gene_type:complete
MSCVDIEETTREEYVECEVSQTKNTLVGFTVVVIIIIILLLFYGTLRFAIVGSLISVCLIALIWTFGPDTARSRANTVYDRFESSVARFIAQGYDRPGAVSEIRKSRMHKEQLKSRQDQTKAQFAGLVSIAGAIANRRL